MARLMDAGMGIGRNSLSKRAARFSWLSRIIASASDHVIGTPEILMHDWGRGTRSQIILTILGDALKGESPECSVAVEFDIVGAAIDGDCAIDVTVSVIIELSAVGVVLRLVVSKSVRENLLNAIHTFRSAFGVLVDNLLLSHAAGVPIGDRELQIEFAMTGFGIERTFGFPTRFGRSGRVIGISAGAKDLFYRVEVGRVCIGFVSADGNREDKHMLSASRRQTMNASRGIDVAINVFASRVGYFDCLGWVVRGG